MNRVSMFHQHGIEFVRHLHQHVAQVNVLLFQHNFVKVIPGDLKELIDQLFQPQGFIQRDMDVFRFLFRGHVRGFFQQA